jgi:DNA modification methylase
MKYIDFLKGKTAIAKLEGFTVNREDLPACLMEHQKDAVIWALRGGCRAIFAQFGLGKTADQLAIMQQIVKKYPKGGKTLIVIPLGVKQEFFRDAENLFQMKLDYVRTDEEVKAAGRYCITNYERVRDGQITPEQFLAISLDEASILRGYGTKTFQEMLKLCRNVKYKFVATATPSPNEYKELIHYAGFLGVMDTGEALTRFFKRDSEKAGNLTLYEHKEQEFWLWVSSWALFVQKPSDLGYSDEGYDLPPLNVIWHRVEIDHLKKVKVDRDGQQMFFHNAAASLPDAAREKRDSVDLRIAEMMKIIQAEPEKHFILWHHLEKEREAIEKALPEAASVYGDLDLEIREKRIIDFSDGKLKYLATKPELSGSGCNFQRHCSDAIFVGIDAKFNDFIQAVHRIQRFQQKNQVNIHIIYVDSEESIKSILLAKWKRHRELTEILTGIIKKYGLSEENIKRTLRRSLGIEREEFKGNRFTLVNNDCVEETMTMPDNSVDLICTSIPFSNHYEYCASYNDFGHNSGNDTFFQQMDFLTPELLRILKPGRVAAIHVKDRILFGNVTGAGFPTLDPFHMTTTFHFMKHGFQFFGMITIETDVVRENNQTYRLGWTEQCKDGSKMGVGCPEYLLLFRKLPTDHSKGYADLPVMKSKTEYTRGQWQIDARAKWNSSGNRLLTSDEVENYDLDTVNAIFSKRAETMIYDYEQHLAAANAMDERGRLPATFETFRIPARTPWVWDDVCRMRTLNCNQSQRGAEKHVCPLQFDIVDRVITRWSNPGELVFDPFCGIGTVPYCAIKLNRRGYGSELNTGYWQDSCMYCTAAEREIEAPTLFDMEQYKDKENGNA